MCVGSMCNGDPLPMLLRFNNAAGQPVIVNLNNTNAVTGVPIVGTVSLMLSTASYGKVHDCPSCCCFSVKP